MLPVVGTCLKQKSGTCYSKFPELFFWIVVEVVIQEEEGGQRLPVVRGPLVQTPWGLIAMHVNLIIGN